MAKFFTVDEANRTLPLVRRIVADIVSTHGQLVERLQEYRTLHADAEADGQRRKKLESELEELTSTVNRFVAELEEIGVLFKGFEEGLVDFYALMDGRPIFLCWKLGEESIEWWHELEAGFAGRQALPAHLSSAGG